MAQRACVLGVSWLAVWGCPLPAFPLAFAGATTGGMLGRILRAEDPPKGRVLPVTGLAPFALHGAAYSTLFVTRSNKVLPLILASPKRHEVVLSS